MDARTQRRLRRAENREKLLKKEAEEKQRRERHRPRPSENETLIGRCEEYKRVVWGYQSQVLSQIRVIDKYRNEVVNLKRQLQRKTDELNEWKKWFNSIGVKDNMMREN